LSKIEIVYPKTHLAESSVARRDSGNLRGFPLHEGWSSLVNDLLNKVPVLSEGFIRIPPEISFGIIDWLDVENSKRYKKKEDTVTFCNIYAYDYCYIINQINHRTYLPHVWWTENAIREMNRGKTLSVIYGGTVNELTANATFDWLIKYSHLYGWNKVENEEDAQELVNQGYVGLVCAKSRIGHITVILPESDTLKGEKDKFGKKMLLQSQAGETNKKVFSDRWYLDMKEYGFFVNM
jgi:hypothetical protein